MLPAQDPGPLASTSVAIHLHWGAPGGRDRLFLTGPRTGLPQRNVQEGGGGAAILTTGKKPAKAQCGFRGWEPRHRRCGSGRPVLEAERASHPSGPETHGEAGGRGSRTKLGPQLNARQRRRGSVLPPEPMRTWEPAGARDSLVCGKVALPVPFRTLTHLSSLY